MKFFFSIIELLSGLNGEKNPSIICRLFSKNELKKKNVKMIWPKNLFFFPLLNQMIAVLKKQIVKVWQFMKYSIFRPFQVNFFLTFCVVSKLACSFIIILYENSNILLREDSIQFRSSLFWIRKKKTIIVMRV